jgi:hypothetical protein
LQIQAVARAHRLWSALVLLLTDMLVWASRPDGQTEPRATRINGRRAALWDLLCTSPHLRPARPEAVAWASPRARRAAAADTGLSFWNPP